MIRKAKGASIAALGLTFAIMGSPAQSQTAGQQPEPIEVASLSVGAAAIAALPPEAQMIEKVGSATPIQGWVQFCRKHPQECAVNASEPAVIRLTPQVWQTINSVNSRINAQIKPITDQNQWGVADIWSFPDNGMGDCEDYQLLKRKLLAQSGIPRRAMRMTVVIDELGEGHAVLMIRTDRGDFILDNKTNAVVSWEQTGYVLVKREGQETGSAWVSLGNRSASPSMTANR